MFGLEATLAVLLNAVLGELVLLRQRTGSTEFAASSSAIWRSSARWDECMQVHVCARIETGLFIDAK